MIFGRKQETKEQRDKFVAYKKFFDSDDGKIVFADLFNQVNYISKTERTAFEQGKVALLNHILEESKIDMKALDKILSGENPYQGEIA